MFDRAVEENPVEAQTVAAAKERGPSDFGPCVQVSDTLPVRFSQRGQGQAAGLEPAEQDAVEEEGQPKTTAEYIQASSRVGRPRQSAGLVVTLYNWTRPRDRSHYERFKAYHRTFYRFVESNSVTPFSGRARDRALSAVLVSMSRMMINGFDTPDSAAHIRDHEATVRSLSQIITDRAGVVDGSEEADTAAHLQELVDEWVTIAQTHQLVWNPYQGRPVGLLRSPEQERGGGIWPTPQSMREVDPPSPVVLRPAKLIYPGVNNNG